MQELTWISEHQKEIERYAGKWIALTEKGVVAFGNSIQEVKSKLKKKKIEALIMKVPRKDEEMSVL